MDGRLKMDQFEPGVTRLEGWLERLEIQMEFRSITYYKKKVLMLLTHVSPETYDALAAWTAPERPKNLQYADLTKLLQERFCKKKLLINCRHALLSENQKPGQTLEEFYRELRQLAGKCEFNNVKDVKDCILTMQFIRGISSDKVRERLLVEQDLQGIQTLQLAQTIETAEKTSLNLKSKNGDYDVLQQRYEREKENKKDPKKKQWNSSAPRCYSCGRNGHLSRDCNKAKGRKMISSGRNHHQITTNKEEEHGLDSIKVEILPKTYCIIPSVNVVSVTPPMMLPVRIEGRLCEMELDTGAALSIVSEVVWQKIGKPTLVPVEYTAKSYTGGRVTFKGVCSVGLQVGDVWLEAKLHVLQTGAPIFGRDLIEKVGEFGMAPNDLFTLAKKRVLVNELKAAKGSNTPQLGTTQTVGRDPKDEIGAMMKNYPAVFSDGLGRCTKLQAKLHMDEDTFHGRKFFRARPVPHALKEQVSQNLEDMLKDGIIEQVMHSEWAAPIVIVPKPNGKIRICGDYKVAVNKCLRVDQYPIPKITELFHVLNRGEHYSKLDLEKAYNQVELEEESKKYTTISTHLGLFRYNRLPFGVANAPAIFQNLMDKMLHGIDNCIVYLDDIVVTGRNRAEHLRTLDKVMKRLKEHGMKVKAEKCEFFKGQIEVLGHVLSRKGISTNPKKIKALLEMPAPKSLKELESLVGFVNYYARFVPQLADLCRPLNKLRRKDVAFAWEKEQQDAFTEIKKRMQETDVLTHFDHTKPVVLATDASEYGLGAVLYHKMEDGTEKVIEYASRMMTATEQKYSQIEKEALGIVWGMEKFQTYLFGLKFLLRTDHQPLLKILGPKAEMPVLAAKRLHRWALKIALFTFDIQYVPTAEFGNADGLSRLVDPTEQITKYLADEELQIKAIQEEYYQGSPFNKAILVQETEKDGTLRTIRDYIRNKWPEKMKKTDDYSYKLWTVREQLHEQEGVILKEGRIVIPAGMRRAVIEMLHKGHPGITRMKEFARSKVWYPNIDRDIESKVKTCTNCQLQANNPQKTVTNLWKEPDQVWERIHIDFAGPVHGYHWFVLVDAKSKWIQVTRMSKITSQDVIKELERTFTIFGLPKMIVSDNGRQFTSHEYTTYCKNRDIKVTYSPPYHPQSNGAAERAVQTFKKMMAKELGGGGVGLDIALRKFLASYRNTPHTTTGKSPAELMFGRSIRTIFDLNWNQNPEAPVATVSQPPVEIARTRPTTTTERKTRQAQERMKRNFNKKAKKQEFTMGATVYVKGYNNDANWVPGIIVERKGEVLYRVHTGKGDWIRHANQMRARMCYTPQDCSSGDEGTIETTTTNLESTWDETENTQRTTTTSASPATSTTSVRTAIELRKSARVTKPVERYSPALSKISGSNKKISGINKPEGSRRKTK